MNKGNIIVRIEPFVFGQIKSTYSFLQKLLNACIPGNTLGHARPRQPFLYLHFTRNTQI